MTMGSETPSHATGYSPSMDRAMEEHAQDARDLAEQARGTAAARFGDGAAMADIHRSFVDVGRRWSEMVPWQTLVGWGAFLGGVGVLLWGVGSISHRQMEVYRALQLGRAGPQQASRPLDEFLGRARELVRR